MFENKWNRILYTSLHTKSHALPALGESIVGFRIYDNYSYSKKILTEVKTAQINNVY